jgi:5-methylcytosine-specific restriction protein B
MSFNEYSNQSVRDFLDKFNEEDDRVWVKTVVGLLINKFPTLDHYLTGGVDKGYIDIRIGKKDKGVQKGSPIFFIGKESKNNGGGACLWIHENMRHILPSGQEWWIKQQKSTDIQVKEWLEGIINHITSENIKDLEVGNGYFPKDYEEQEVDLSIITNVKENGLSLNTILYGSPGTGKTYHTINKALEILDKPFLDANFDERSELKKRFDELQKEGRIAFATFHQSFSYEDFVEGIRAELIDGKINYVVKSGMFKCICTSLSDYGFSSAFQYLKEICLRNPINLKTKTGLGFSVFSEIDKRNILVKISSSSSLQSISEQNIYKCYCNPSIEDKDLTMHSYVKPIVSYMVDELRLTPYGDAPSGFKINKNRVLIIDEINRGNIANIFGELITLIEPSKRAGSPEALSVTLPYSKEAFSVPNNLYIIGTMNTADRSLALMDTALRRRFHFEEMMPKPELLADIEVEGINIQRLLEKMNKRITALYDREHTLGHAFFFPLQNEPTLMKLREIFERQILPLLQEYFFEDWNKIRLVVGKELILEETVDDDLFDDNTDGLVNSKTYRINHAALDKAETYIRIYNRAAKQGV